MNYSNILEVCHHAVYMPLWKGNKTSNPKSEWRLKVSTCIILDKSNRLVGEKELPP